MRRFMHMRLISWMAGAALAVGAAGLGLGMALPEANAQGEPQAEGQQQVSEQTQSMLRNLKLFNEHEIEISEMAADDAESEQVQQFADNLVNRHESVGEQLDKLADNLGIDLEAKERPRGAEKGEEGEAERRPAQAQPGEQMPRQEGMQEKDIQKQMKTQYEQEKKQLEQAKKAGDFDQVYLTTVIDRQRNWVQKIEDTKDQVQNEQVKQFITQLQPRLQEHVQRAQQLRGAVAAR